MTAFPDFDEVRHDSALLEAASPGGNMRPVCGCEQCGQAYIEGRSVVHLEFGRCPNCRSYDTTVIPAVEG